MSIKDPVIRLDDAIQAAGNQTKLARVLRKARSTVCEWRQHGEIPPLYAYRLLQIYPKIPHQKRPYE